MRKFAFGTLVFVVVLMAVGCQSVSLLEQSRTLSVQGTGKVLIMPDIAAFTVMVSEVEETTKAAQNSTNQKVNEIIRILETAGVEKRDLGTTSLEFRPEYRWIEDRQVLVGQRVSQTVRVTVRNIDAKTEVLSTIIDELGEITNITMSSISFNRADPSAE